MLEQLIKLYTASMMQDVRSPIPHLAGPPGTNKSGVAQQLANLVGKKLHIVNVARLSPLEIEGLQMPIEENTRLKMLINRLWADLEEGDIVFFDEFMRGFPEVYNGLLDIVTSRHVAGHDLPKVFFLAASNSVSTYDEALRDRLIHIYVPDIRKSATARARVKQIMIDELGMRNHVHFVGAQSRADLAALMRHSQALLVPSHSETFGLVALEGAASDYDLIAG